MNFTLLSRSKFPAWEILFILYLFAAYLVPSFALGATTMLFLLLAYCVYLVFVDQKLFTTVVVPLILILLLATAYTFLTDTATIADGASNRDTKRFISKTYQYLSLYFPVFLFTRINHIASKAQKKIFIGIGIALMVYVIVSTWIYLVDNPDATRHWDGSDEIAAKDIGGYYFVYAVPIIISAISIIMLQHKGWVRFFSLALVVAGIIFLVDAQYTLAILIAIIGVLIQVYRHIKSTLNKALFILGCLIVSVFLPQILAYFIRIIPSYQVATRLSEIRAFLTGQGAGGYNLSSRLTLYGDSINAFLSSPFIGNRQLDFDGHSTFLTVLSDTGILGGIPFYALLVIVCKQMQKYMGTHKQQSSVLIIMFCMMGLTNPVHSSQPLGLVAFCLAPLTIQLILKEEPHNDQTLEN